MWQEFHVDDASRRKMLRPSFTQISHLFESLIRTENEKAETQTGIYTRYKKSATSIQLRSQRKQLKLQAVRLRQVASTQNSMTDVHAQLHPVYH